MKRIMIKRGAFGAFSIAVLLAVSLISLVPSISALTFQSTSTPDIKVTMLSQEPDPVEPGEVVKVKFKVENNGSETRDSAVFKISPEYPFSLYSGKKERDMGVLRAVQTGSDAVIVEYLLRVDENAVERDEPLRVEVKVGESAQTYKDEFKISILTRDAVLGISGVSLSKSEIVPGESSTLDMTLSNMADSSIKNIKVKLDLTDLPLAAEGSNLERRVPLLRSGFKKIISYPLKAEPSAESGLYKVPLTIDYEDAQGNSYNSSDEIAISIGSVPVVAVYAKDKSILSAGSKNSLTLEVANEGRSNIKFLEMRIGKSDAYKILSPSYFYIGGVDSDDTDSEEIELFIKDRGEISIPVELDYLDANNNKYSKSREVKVEALSSSDLIKYGMKKSSLNMYMTLFVILLLTVGLIWYLKNRKKR